MGGSLGPSRLPLLVILNKISQQLQFVEQGNSWPLAASSQVHVGPE